ncbi:hypothetical protein ACJIZ3_009141 [Penstemon smallii]|uniref:RING-type E3 ubiquitin transferase n=1 Tax=Penstemon smallii TaxID=265156 RepID=A0ABD3TCH6_9LAMI
MGSEGEISDLNLPIHVAVGRNVKEGKLLLNWAVKNFEGRDICLVHVHQHNDLVSLSNGKLPVSKLMKQAIKACQEFIQPKMQKLIDQYLEFLSQMGIQADKVWIEMSNIEEGILQLITQHNIRRLIMGAAAETFNTKNFSEFNSSKAMIVCQQSPPSCHIWFICKGSLVYKRPVVSSSQLTTTSNLSSSTNNGGTLLKGTTKENKDVDSVNVQSLALPTLSKEEAVATTPTTPIVGQTSQEDSTLLLKVESPQHLSRFSSSTSSDCKFEEVETCDVRNKLEQAVKDLKNARQRALEESLRRWRAEEDAFEAVREAEAAGSLCNEEMSRNKELDEQLIRLRQEIETMKNQHGQSLKELRLIQDQKPALETQLREAYCSEKEIEVKFFQAVYLLRTFKETRDKLQLEYDSVIREVNKVRTLQTEDTIGILGMGFFGISFSDIVDATNRFNPSKKIGEGRYGSVFKATLGHVKVAIKMLPSSGSQSELEFKHEVEVLSRVRHPNLVTLIGACPESRSLIYEYIENRSLENYLSGIAKTPSLSWQTRIRIAIEICSTLLFLHANNTYSVHGNLKPSNILLDSNFVCKISDFGIHTLTSQNENPCKNDPEISAYIDPEAFDNGELTPESDIYSFGIVLLRLLTARSAAGVIRDVKCALERGNLDTVLDISAGDWPLENAKQLANLALSCCKKDRLDRPNLVSEVWTVLEPMRKTFTLSQLTSTLSCNDSRTQQKIPSHFVCPIYQEVMKDPHIAPDGFTYEGDAIKGWFNSGHMTSPMTNMKLHNCDLLPNYALYYAIQEWEQNS